MRLNSCAIYLDFNQMIRSWLLVWSPWNAVDESAELHRNVHQIQDTETQSQELLQSFAF